MRRCTMSNKLTKEVFTERAIGKFGEVFDYSQVIYKGIDTEVLISCPEHGEFLQTPYNHLLSKHGCPKCGIKAAAQSKEKDLESFIKKARSIHGTTYSYDNSVYSSAKEKITITCPAHGDFTQLVSGHLSGYGCKQCANNGKGRVDMHKPCKLYYFNVEGTSLYKIGITAQSLNERYRTKFDREQINMIFCKEYTTGQEAYEKEQELLNTYNHLLYKGPKVLGSGNTELFTEDIFKGNYKDYYEDIT